MKAAELHKIIIANGWRIARQNGSHVIYEKMEEDTPLLSTGVKK